MEKSDIETAARDLQVKIWKSRVALSIDAGPLVDMFHPSIAAACIGIQYDVLPNLGNFGCRGEQFTVAGLINRPNKLIQVSSRFPLTTQRFTGAHELGHFILHGDEVMHRDRPISGSSLNGARRNSKEWQADYFAACFLMPEKLVWKAFEIRFGSRKPFEFDDTAGFWLCPNEPESVICANADDQAAILSNATRFGGRSFIRLCDEFKVSGTAMAIRLLELGIVV